MNDAPNLPARITINRRAVRPFIRPIFLYAATIVMLSIVQASNPQLGMAQIFQFIWSAAGVTLLGIMAAFATYKAVYYNPTIRKFMADRPKYPTVFLLNFGTFLIVAFAIAMNMARLTLFPAAFVPALVALIPIGLGCVVAFLLGSVRNVLELETTVRDDGPLLGADKRAT